MREKQKKAEEKKAADNAANGVIPQAEAKAANKK